MNIYHAISLILTITGTLAYINARYIKFPTTIALMVGSMIISLAIFVIGYFEYSNFHLDLYESLIELDFHELVLDGLLSFLLFAGALTFNLQDLKDCKWEISILASFSLLISIFFISSCVYYILPLLGLSLSYIYCLIFGALISPTDPIAVLAIFKQTKAPRKLNTIVSGESLFNDGIAIVMFITFYHVAFLGDQPTISTITLLLIEQAGGGIIYGMILGWIGYELIKPIDNFKAEVLITIAIATGGYALAEIIHVSGPLAMVVSGIMIGNSRRDVREHDKRSYHELESFWEVIDEILNAVLFMLLGLEVLLITHHQLHIWIMLFVIPIVLLGRTIGVSIPLSVFKRYKHYPNHLIKIVIWGGLRGALSVALVLSLPPGDYRNLLLMMTYPVVIFSVIIQGLTVGKLVQLAKG